MKFELILFLFLQLSPVLFNADFIVMLHTQRTLAIARKNNQRIIKKKDKNEKQQ